MKKFLICSCEESVVDYPPSFVIAETADKAMKKFLHNVYSKDKIFRHSVLDLAVNMTFVEQFYFNSEQEGRRFDNEKEVLAEPEVVKNRIESFFSVAPHLGEIFIKYMETRDISLISDDVFEFIATSGGEEKHGHVAIDIDLLNTA